MRQGKWIAAMMTTDTAIVMAVASLAIEHGMQRFAPGASTFAQSTRLAAAIGGGLLTLAAMARLLRMEEFNEVVEELRMRVRKLLRQP